MKPLAAVLALLLAGAAVACSDPVPPPGATLSGTVWIDTNANGIRDKCDSPKAGPRPFLQLRGAGTQTRETKANKDGKFFFHNVPRGRYDLVVRQNPGFQWPVTTPKNDQRMGYALDLRGYEKLEGLDFGVVGYDPLTIYPDGYGLLVVLFDDRDRDGRQDVDECAVENPAALAVSADGAISLGTVGRLAIIKFEYLRRPPEKVKLAYPEWSADTVLVGTEVDKDGCPQESEPVAVPETRLYQAAIGVRRAQGTASVDATAFVDFDADRIRDEDEPDAYVPIALIGPCNGPRMAPSMPASRGYGFRNVPPGHWRLQLDLSPSYGGYDGEIVATASTVELDLREDDEVWVEFGVSYPDAAFLNVAVVADQDLNGQADPDEPGISGLRVCADLQFRFSRCSSTSESGRAFVGPLEPGPQAISVFRDSSTTGPETVAEHEVYLELGETASITIAVPP